MLENEMYWLHDWLRSTIVQLQAPGRCAAGGFTWAVSYDLLMYSLCIQAT